MLAGHFSPSLPVSVWIPAVRSPVSPSPAASAAAVAVAAADDLQREACPVTSAGPDFSHPPSGHQRLSALSLRSVEYLAKSFVEASSRPAVCMAFAGAERSFVPFASRDEVVVSEAQRSSQQAVLDCCL